MSWWGLGKWATHGEVEGAERWGPEGWGGGGRGVQNFRAVFPLSAPSFALFVSLNVFSWKFWWCLKRQGHQMCTLGVLGLSCEAQRTLREINSHYFPHHTHCGTPTHGANPAWRWSPSTSQLGGVSPSAPWAHLRSNKEWPQPWPLHKIR